MNKEGWMPFPSQGTAATKKGETKPGGKLVSRELRDPGEEASKSAFCH